MFKPDLPASDKRDVARSREIAGNNRKPTIEELVGYRDEVVVAWRQLSIEHLSTSCFPKEP